MHCRFFITVFKHIFNFVSGMLSDYNVCSIIIVAKSRTSSTGI